MAAPGELTLPPFVEGDDWPGIPFLSVTMEGGDPMDVPLESVRMYFRRYPQELVPAVKLHSGTGGDISIDDANAWEISIPAIKLPKLKQGQWIFDIEFTRTDGVVQTIIRGKIEVLPQITY